MCTTVCGVATQAAAASAHKKGKQGKKGKKGAPDITAEERLVEEAYIQQLLSRAAWSEKQITASMKMLETLFNQVPHFARAAAYPGENAGAAYHSRAICRRDSFIHRTLASLST